MGNRKIMQDLQEELFSLGITENYIGFFFASYAAFLAVKQPDCLLFVTKWLYPCVAKKYQTTPTAVEKSIRTVINIIWLQNSDILEEMSPFRLEKRPTVSQFISILAHGVKSGEAA